MYSNDILTVPVNLAGPPAISIPSGLDSQGVYGHTTNCKSFNEGKLFGSERLLKIKIIYYKSIRVVARIRLLYFRKMNDINTTSEVSIIH